MPGLFKPNNVAKSTIYIGSGEEGKALVEAINVQIKRTKLDFSPMMIKAFRLYHGLDKRIEKEAGARGVSPVELINQAVAAYLKQR